MLPTTAAFMCVLLLLDPTLGHLIQTLPAHESPSLSMEGVPGSGTWCHGLSVCSWKRWSGLDQGKSGVLCSGGVSRGIGGTVAQKVCLVW